jgi:hypothetical protein
MLTDGFDTATFGSGMLSPPPAAAGALGAPGLADDPAGSRFGPLMILVYWLSPSGIGGGAGASSCVGALNTLVAPSSCLAPNTGPPTGVLDRNTGSPSRLPEDMGREFVFEMK